MRNSEIAAWLLLLIVGFLWTVSLKESHRLNRLIEQREKEYGIDIYDKPKGGLYTPPSYLD